MDWSWAQTYYVVASIGGLIATALNVVLFLRSRPDRMKSKVDEAVRPISDRIAGVERRLAEVETDSAQQAAKHDISIKALDTEISGRLDELNRSMHQQDKQLAQLVAAMQHGVTRRDVDTLHHRVTEAAKAATATQALVGALQTRLQNIEDFLRESGSRD